MSFDEIAHLLEAANQNDRESWEKVRQICFYTVAIQTDKIKKPADLFKFPWEEEKKKPSRKLTKEQVDKKFNEAKKWLDKKKLA